MSKPRKSLTKVGTFGRNNVPVFRETLVEQNKYADKPKGTRAAGKIYKPLKWHPTMAEKRNGLYEDLPKIEPEE